MIPPRVPLCRRCDDTGVVRLPPTRGNTPFQSSTIDACPDCVRAGEFRWRAQQARLQSEQLALQVAA
jgi:hypothetical protein